MSNSLRHAVREKAPSAPAAKEFEPRTHSFASTERVEPTSSHLRMRESPRASPSRVVRQLARREDGRCGCWPKRTGAGAAPIAGFAPKAGVALNNPAGAGPASYR